MTDRAEVLGRLRKTAEEIRDSNICGWGNAIDCGADLIESLSAEVEALKAERVRNLTDMQALIEDHKYMVGIAERGTGMDCPEDVPNRTFLLNYVKGIEAERDRLMSKYTLCEKEPFGYFLCDTFGWGDCTKDVEGAVALYAPADSKGG